MDAHYTLRCQGCGKKYADAFREGFLLSCPEEHSPALLRAECAQTNFEVQRERPGLFRFAHWRPVRRIPESAPVPIVYQSKGLARRLGLEQLWIAFSGYWPESGVYDALAETQGCTYAVTNDEAVRAGEIFLQEEGCDLDPAAEVAVASLFQAIEQGKVEKHEPILLNISGGGYKLLKQHKTLSPQNADLLLAPDDLKDDGLLERIQRHLDK